MNKEKYTLVLKEREEPAHEVRLAYIRPLFTHMEFIISPVDAEVIMRRYLGDMSLDLKEYFWLICLSRANAVLSISRISEGGITGTTVSIREIIQTTFLINAPQCILVHNHPSGQLKPSRSDERLTQHVAEASQLIDLSVLDHLILTSEGYYSFATDSRRNHFLKSPSSKNLIIMKQKPKVPMSLDQRSGYGWELLATFVQRAKEARWDIPDIGSVVLEALSGNYHTLVETLESHTKPSQTLNHKEWYDSTFINRTHQKFKVSHLRMIYYFLKRMEFAISQEQTSIEKEWLAIFSHHDLSEMIQHMTSGFARIEFENINSSNKEQLLALITQHSVMMNFLIHCVEDHLSSCMQPVCTQTDIDYLLSYTCKIEEEIAAKPFDHWTVEDWGYYRKCIADSGLVLGYAIVEGSISDDQKYEHIDSLDVFQHYQQAWFAFRMRIDQNPLTDERIVYLWIEPNT